MERISINSVIFLGCGAVGSLIASHLNCDPAIPYDLVDDDTVGRSNLGTSIYEEVHLGMPKVNALGHLLYRRNRRKCEARLITVTQKMIKILWFQKGLEHLTPTRLFIDTFDNPVARNLTREIGEHVIHIGVSPDHTGSIIWNEIYPELDISFDRGDNPVCTNQLGAPIIRLTAMHAVNIIEHFLRTGEKLNKGVTL